MAVSAPLERAAHLSVALLPSGALLVDVTGANDDDKNDGLSAAARVRVAAAFARGPGHGLLDLGTTALDAPLSPALAFLREVGRAFVTRLRAVPDLEERRDRVDVDCPPDECFRLAGAVPPMPGGEYADAEWIVARWADIGRAFAEEIRAYHGAVAEWLHARHPSWHVVGRVCLHLAENRGDDEHPFAFLAIRGPRQRRRQGAASAPRARPGGLVGRLMNPSFSAPSHPASSHGPAVVGESASPPTNWPTCSASRSRSSPRPPAGGGIGKLRRRRRTATVARSTSGTRAQLYARLTSDAQSNAKSKSQAQQRRGRRY